MNFGVNVPDYMWGVFLIFCLASYVVMPLLLFTVGMCLDSRWIKRAAYAWIAAIAVQFMFFPGGFPCGRDCWFTLGLG